MSTTISCICFNGEFEEIATESCLAMLAVDVFLVGKTA